MHTRAAKSPNIYGQSSSKMKSLKTFIHEGAKQLQIWNSFLPHPSRRQVYCHEQLTSNDCGRLPTDDLKLQALKQDSGYGFKPESFKFVRTLIEQRENAVSRSSCLRIARQFNAAEAFDTLDQGEVDLPS